MFYSRPLTAGSAAGCALVLVGWYACQNKPRAFPRGFVWGAEAAGNQIALALLVDEAIGPNSLRDARQSEWYAARLDPARHDDFVGVLNCEWQRWDDKGRINPPHVSTFNTMGSEFYPPCERHGERSGGQRQRGTHRTGPTPWRGSLCQAKSRSGQVF
ncbi:MAG: hypothetical protein NVSMB69_06080 [Novosphingobium sp.]